MTTLRSERLKREKRGAREHARRRKAIEYLVYPSTPLVAGLLRGGVLFEGRVAAPVSARLAVVDEFGVAFSLTSALELLFVPIPAFDAE